MAPLGMDLKAKRLRKRSDYGYILDYRLRWSDNDMFQHMNNPYYGVLIDSVINTYLIKECGYKVTKSTQAAIIANTYCDYFGSVAYPDVVDVGLRVVKLGKSSVMYEVGIFLQGEDSVKAVGGSTHVFVEQDTVTGALGKVRPEGMPKEARHGYTKLLGKQAADGEKTVDAVVLQQQQQQDKKNSKL